VICCDVWFSGRPETDISVAYPFVLVHVFIIKTKLNVSLYITDNVKQLLHIKTYHKIKL